MVKKRYWDLNPNSAIQNFLPCDALEFSRITYLCKNKNFVSQYHKYGKKLGNPFGLSGTF